MRTKIKPEKPYLTPNEVAEMLMVSPTSVRAWSSEGKIPSSTTPGGHRRFMRTDVERFARAEGLVLRTPDDQVTRILIVDDEKSLADYLAEVFKHVDADVETMVADNGFDAGRLVHSFQPHIVLLDLYMPEIDGFEVCEKIKFDPALRGIRIIAMTGLGDEANIRRILQSGAEDCLLKPFDTTRLLSAVGMRPAAN